MVRDQTTHSSSFRVFRNANTEQQQDHGCTLVVTGSREKTISTASTTMTQSLPTAPDVTMEEHLPVRESSLELQPSQLLVKVLHGFATLKDAPPELWKAYLLKFLDSFSYFTFSIILTIFLSQDFGFSDVNAGLVYGAWGALITVFGLLTGFVVDNLGVARSLQIGFALQLLGRIGIFWSNNPTVVTFHILCTLPLGGCLGIPVLTTGIRRYTTESARGFAFGLFYVIMNCAALLSGPIVDLMTLTLNNNNNHQQVQEGTQSWKLTSSRAIILTGVVANFAALAVSWTVREIKVECPDGTMPDSPARVAPFRPRTGTIRQILKETCASPSFRRFLAVCLIMLNVRMVFRHLDATLPKYMQREFGDNVPKGTIYSINPLMIIILVPLVQAATTNVDPLVMMHYGSYISAASVFFLAMRTSIWACVLFVFTLSIGEAIWSPRLYDYTMSVCKEGREGTYMALTSAPLFLAKLPVGFLSGSLLQEFCPSEGPRNSKEMWLIIGLLTATSPILLTLCWRYIAKKDDKDEYEDDDLRGNAALLEVGRADFEEPRSAVPI